jgi:hypothetical protein
VSNVAVTDLAAVIETAQVFAEPLQAPLQPAKVEPLAAVAVSVTLVPVATDAVQVLPQSRPPVLEDTVPWPVPDRDTLSRYVAAAPLLDELPPLLELELPPELLELEAPELLPLLELEPPPELLELEPPELLPLLEPEPPPELLELEPLELLAPPLEPPPLLPSGSADVEASSGMPQAATPRTSTAMIARLRWILVEGISSSPNPARRRTTIRRALIAATRLRPAPPAGRRSSHRRTDTSVLDPGVFPSRAGRRDRVNRASGHDLAATRSRRVRRSGASHGSGPLRSRVARRPEPGVEDRLHGRRARARRG